MQLILRRSFDVLEVSRLCRPREVHVIVPAGTHEVERIPNPYPKAETEFIVLKGTKTGAAEQFWRLFPEDATIVE